MKIRNSSGKLKTLWHLTSRKSFKPSDIGFLSRPVLYGTTNPYFWVYVIRWAEGRRWAAELDILPGHPPLIPEHPIMPETELDPNFVRVVRIVPIGQAIEESTTKANIEDARRKREKLLLTRERLARERAVKRFALDQPRGPIAIQIKQMPAARIVLRRRPKVAPP